MDSYGFPNSFDKEEEIKSDKNSDPGTTNGPSPPINNGNTGYTSGNFGAGNFNNGYSYGYPYGATITSDYGYSYSAEDINNSDYPYDADATGNAEYENTGSSYTEYSDNTEQSSPSNASDGPSTSEDPSENGLKHMVDIMKAALPHLDGGIQESAGLLIKASELMDSLHNVRNNDNVSAFSLHRQSIDIEALLNSIRTVCYARERQLIDNVLNFIRMKNMFDTFSSLSSMMSFQSDEQATNENKNESTESNGTGFNSNMMDILSSMLTPEQKSTFDSMSMMMNMMQQ